MTVSATDEHRAGAAPPAERRLYSGVETLGELLVARRLLDQRAGLDTAAFVSGYPGSPLGTVDLVLERQGARLAEHRVVHRPGLNEELAAAAVWGSQMGAAVPYEGPDGVVGAWYGKGPGLDRCGDVLKHANMMGTGPNGGAVLFVGDDPSAKSSTLPYDTNMALADASVPVLVPSDQQDLFDLGIEAFLLSRFTGSWVGLRIVTAVADGIGAVDTSLDRLALAAGALGIPGAGAPEVLVDGEAWQHRPTGNILGGDLEELWLDRRLRAAAGWAEARGVDRLMGAPSGARLGIVCAGKTYRDVLGALEACGVTPEGLADAGIRILKLAMTHPVVPGRVLELADSVDQVLVVEEKRPFVEQQVRAILHEAGRATPVRGKRDAEGRLLVPATGELSAERLVPLLGRVAPDLAPAPAPPSAPAGRRGRTLLPLAELPGRTPAFCSGCPHNRSTVVPEGSITGGGVGCHGMIHFEPRHAEETFIPPTPMGAEGVHWVGLAPFVGDRHLFQNLGDGTFSHSGSLAVRACVAAGVHITFKLLYNSAVAMTGGQDVAGLMDVPAITRSLAAEGVGAITICTEDVARYGSEPDFAPGVTVRPREDVLDVQEELRATPGVSVLIYDQRCAAEARRLRKRGLLEDPPKRVVINQAVCEGCGDCSRVSNCLSVQPVDTEFGERREIHQSSCNKDYSCLEGDCPSFVTLEPRPRRLPAALRDRLPGGLRLGALGSGRGARRRNRGSAGDGQGSGGVDRPRVPAGDLPSPPVGPLDRRFSVYTTGIGGTGIVTANRVVARAAALAGHAVAGVDQTGLSQKAGAVVSHLHIAPGEGDITTATVADGGAGLYLSGDLLQAASAAHLAKVDPGRTFAVVDAALVPTATMLQGNGSVDPAGLAVTLSEAVGDERTLLLDSTRLAEKAFGDHLPANVVLLGAAFQLGALPLPLDAIESAIAEGPAAATNAAAFAWGRWAAADPEAVASALGEAVVGLAAVQRNGGGTSNGDGPDAGAGSAQAAIWEPTGGATAAAPQLVEGTAVPARLRPLVERRAAQLVDYQGADLARRWLGLVARAAEVDDARHGHALTEAVAEGWYKLLSYKDEYEVARLHLRLDTDEVAAELGFGDGYRVRYNLHPPTLRAMGMDRKIAFGPGARTMFRGLAAMRRVRGTPLDVFGMARHRREERALAAEYAELMGSALGRVTADTYDTALELARSVSSIKGYEDIKSDAIARWRTDTAPLRTALRGR